MLEIQLPSVFVPSFLAAMNRPALLSAFALAAVLHCLVGYTLSPLLWNKIR